ncbi:MAG: hypothetical protein HYZ26_07875 [Chloroflexi bacterium]|nr:hypothetical protein [Chloroflexota bacterium]
MVESTLESFTSLLVPMLALLGVGLLWLLIRSVFRLASRTFLLGCGMLFGLGVAWLFVAAVKFF